jgi:hypothetical protein
MKVHELKTVQPYFDQISRGAKKFELRKNDRDFKWGDILVLREYSTKTETYQGNDLVVRVTAVLDQFVGLQQGYCILSISEPI